MALAQDWINELLAKVNIADVVGNYVTLQNKGGRLWGCCPFHNEKTPSFTVNPDKGFFHCFGCGKGGNVINFLMESEKMTFPDACAFLADKVNLPMPQKTDDSGYEKRKAARLQIYEMNKKIARMFHEALYSAKGKQALDYLHGRGVTDGIIKTFGLGFAEDSWDKATGMLEKEGYTKLEIQAAGLAKAGEGKYYDTFRNRVMMPIINPFSEVIGFGGRVMDDAMPKYLNSPETAAFNKSRNLYNLNLVRKQKNLQYLVLVEGYMDVIALYSHGIQNCVATLGTALTADQARLIKRYVNTAYISYDGDEAGRKATMRATGILEKEGIECRVVNIPGGEDPDDFLKKNKKDGYMKLLKAARPVIDYKFDVAAEWYDLSDGYQKEKYVKECIGILKEVESAVAKEKYVKNLSERTGFSEHAIMQDIGMPVDGQKVEYKRETPAQQKKQGAPEKAENYIIALLCADPMRIQHLEKYISAKEFQNTANAKAFDFILQCVKKGFVPQGDEILSVLETEEESDHIALLLSSDEEVFGEGKNSDSFLADCVKRIKLRNKEKELAAFIAKSREELSEPEKKEVNARIKQITDELHKIKKSL